MGSVSDPCAVGNPALRVISEIALELHFCALPVTRNSLPHEAPDVLFTQFTLFTQAFFSCLWEWWEKEASRPGHRPVFQIPSIAQTGFRKLSPQPTDSLLTISDDFPLFLAELRVLLSLFFITPTFIHLPSRGSPYLQNRNILCPVSNAFYDSSAC